MINIAILYKCSWIGCSKILEDKGYCEEHNKKVVEQKRKRYKEYDAIRRLDEEYLKHKTLYDSEQWERTRDSVISNCCAIDIIEYYRTGKIIQGETVHHIITLEDDWEMRLILSNLIYVTEKNHRRIHVEYAKGDKEKARMQEILLSLLDKWNEDYSIHSI